MKSQRLGAFGLIGGLLAAACGGGGAPAAPTAAPPAAKPATQATTAPAASPAAKAAAPAQAPASPVAKAATSPVASPATKAAAGEAAALRSASPALPSMTKVGWATTSGNIMYAPFFIALSKGYFKDENMDIEMVVTGSGAKSLTTIATGSTPLGYFDASNGVKPIQLGQPLVAIGNLYAEPYLQLIIKKDALEKTGVKPTDPIAKRGAALKGLKIGVTTAGSGSDRTARMFLQAGGLNPERDAEIVATGSSANQVAGFTRGALDAVVASSPGGDELVVRQNGVRLINLPAGDIPELKGITSFAIWSHKPSLQQNPALGVGAMKAIARSIDLIQTKPEEAKQGWVDGIKMMADSQPPAPEIVNLGWEAYLAGFPKDPTISRESLLKVIKFASDVEGETFTTTPEQMYDPQYLQQALKALGQ